MRPFARVPVLLGLLAASAALPGPSDPSAQEVEHNRRLLARWREDPAHYARLKRDLQAFEALPPERQAALRQLDRELHQQDPAVRARLWHVMDRYASWLERLPEEEREKVEEAPSATERLRVIRDLREREWVARLPKAQRDRLGNARPEERAGLLTEFRRQELDRQLEWQRGLGATDAPVTAGRMPPAALADLPPDVHVFVTVSLYPLLTPAERERLRKADASSFARTLLELVDRHPAGLPGPATGPSAPKDLPPKLREFVRDLPGPEKRKLRLVQGSWPTYAVLLTQTYRARVGDLPHELGPCRPEEFAPPLRQFLTGELLPALGEKEKERLSASEGRWPEYPREVAQLARRHGLRVPGLAPPGPRGYWDRLRAAVEEDRAAR